MKKEKKQKTGGRKAGTPNRTTTEMKEAIKTIIDAEFEQLDKHLELLTAKERLDFLAKLLPYVVPKQNEIDHKSNGQQITSIERHIIGIDHNNNINNN